MHFSLGLMVMIAVVFPGQGAQRPGMFRDWYAQSDVARETIDHGSELLDFDLKALCFGDDPRIDQTEYTQVALLVGELGMFRALVQEFGLCPAFFGGHSLGEYTALAAAEVLPFDVAVALVRRRGILMQTASPAGAGGMLAVTAGAGFDWSELARPLAESGLDTASLNTARQRVFAGSLCAIEQMEAVLASLAGRQRCEFKRLNVSAPFHSRLMAPVEDAMRSELGQVAIRFQEQRSSIVTSNATGAWHAPHRAALVEALARQVTSPVLWQRNMELLAAAADRVIEIGPSRPLAAFFRSIEQAVSSVVSFQTAQRGVSA